MFRAARMSSDGSLRRLRSLAQPQGWHSSQGQIQNQSMANLANKSLSLSTCSASRNQRFRGCGIGTRKGFRSQIRYCSASTDGKVVSIGDVNIKVKQAKNPELVPVKFISDKVPQAVLKHLRWIMQKDQLGQDIFLIGAPGPLRRNVAMMYLEMTQREAEYVSLSRDTTETDLKQRREIRSGTAYHIDQSAVRAATEGRVLVLEGIEKAERNVLPVLNNLLENREMQLDDGRFLMSADRYDKLLLEHSEEELKKWNLVRVDENFRVIALGLPVPRYQGNPLDPPLRSRFQARDIHPLPFKDHMDVLSLMRDGDPEHVSKLLSFGSTLNSEESSSLGLQDFPLDNLHKVIQIMNAVPSQSAQKVIQRLYPFTCMLNKEGQASVKDALGSFNMLEDGSQSTIISEVHCSSDNATVEFSSHTGAKSTIQVKRGTLQPSSSSQKFVSTPYHSSLLADIMMSHMVHDFCIVGPRGCGKTVIVKEFADLLGYHMETIMLYQDMTSRDLLQQRTTLPNGDTAWQPSPLVAAALEGSLAVLDGVHRVNNGTFAVLHRLIHDRELNLFDGSRLLSHEKYEAIKEKNGFNDSQMAEKGVFRIHPSFRVCALSEPPVLGSSSGQWLTSEVLTMFLFHHMRDLTQQEELQILTQMVPHLSNMQPILDLTHKIREAPDVNLKSAATSLSTRQLLRIASRLADYPTENLNETVHKACLSRFLPRLTKTALDDELEAVGLTPAEKSKSIEKSMTCEVKEGVLRIGSTTVDVHSAESKMKVPDVLFYENPQHLSVMEDMLKDFLLGEHLLLVGNQGVGKNKIIDRFLHLLNRPREYLQLHRDTTVQTLTLQPTVVDGVIRYEDSPLVRAVRNGHILVVDEADKAPTHVTCILKTLVESGEMHLADGRRIVHADSGMAASEKIIIAHPSFRMMVLANRPGFPFLGNDFFGAMGDIFSCHAIDNPDPESEMAMLRQYGPDVPDDILKKLVLAFGELRDMADQGLITYPYSTREVVNMVKHLQKYPKEGLSTVVKNVFDFDMYNKELTETVVEALHKHGIPVGANPNNIALAKEFPLPELQHRGSWEVRKQGGRTQTSVMKCPVEDKPLRIKGPVQLMVQSHQMDKTDSRSMAFSEQEAFWSLPIHETSAIADVAVTKGSWRQPGQKNDDIIHIATVSPITLYTMNPSKNTMSFIDLYDIFPSPSRRSASYKPRIHIAPLGFPLDSTVIVHEESSNITLSLNYENGEVSRLEMGSVIGAAAEKITKSFRQQQGNFKICSTFAHEPEGFFLHYKQDSDTISVVHTLEGRCFNINTPIHIHDIQMLTKYDWLITEAGNSNRYLLSHTKEQPFDFHLQSIADSASPIEYIELAAPLPLPDSHLSAALDQKIKSPNRVFVSPQSYASVAVGLPELSTIDIYEAARRGDQGEENKVLTERMKDYMKHPPLRSKLPIQYMPDSGQVVRILATWQVPKEVYPDGKRPRDLSGYLEVTDIVNKHIRYVPIPGVISNRVYNQWFYSGSASSDVGVVMAPMSHDGIVTVDNGGCVRMWQTALFYLDQSLKSWRRLIGEGEKELKMDFLNERELPKLPDDFDPKFGKVDPTGAPHVGGGTWAGGSGGMNTAGLGGVGGPFRLDIGQDVHQIPDWQKEQLMNSMPDDVKKAARDMAQKAFKERLKQIKMSEFDADLYDQFIDNVRGQIKSLRIILDSLQAKGKERQWLRHQTHGDFDDAKLIEGLTGERAIYKRRGEKEPEMGSPQQKPKLVRLLCDVSGSMYRFNSYDSRLEREMEAMLMVMEALESYEQKIKYDIIGHSGEGYQFGIVSSSKPPKNNKERLDVLKTLQAHSQFCISGDHTLEATKHAIDNVVKEEADEHFVIVLSDANLDRYGIRPKHFAEILTSNENVNAYVIFIGSLGDQATRIVKQMPSGRAFVCMDTKNLPQILQQIFTSTMLSSR